MEDWEHAAQAAQALLDQQHDGSHVVIDPAEILFNDQVFVFAHRPERVNNTALVVDRPTGVARFLVVSPWEPMPYVGLRPVLDVPEDGPEATPLTIVLSD